MGAYYKNLFYFEAGHKSHNKFIFTWLLRLSALNWLRNALAFLTHSVTAFLPDPAKSRGTAGCKNEGMNYLLSKTNLSLNTEANKTWFPIIFCPVLDWLWPDLSTWNTAFHKLFCLNEVFLPGFQVSFFCLKEYKFVLQTLMNRIPPF